MLSVNVYKLGSVILCLINIHKTVKFFKNFSKYQINNVQVDFYKGYGNLEERRGRESIDEVVNVKV